ncbi:histidine phosphatase family protein [Frankia sp. CcI49]|uniref:histidine phosphatase family protein n=1 Tax=Frankia sp. CcI49 TaxID=1745382 RepID=UPI0009772B6C|nr:histidine phosphatase family protein [Frankia sp. CcI49]
MPDTDLMLVRHGEAHCNIAWIAGGDLGCTGLTQRGHAQAADLARALRPLHDDRPIDVLYASPRLRVRETAQAVSDELTLPVRIEPRLAGPDHGEADGRPWADIIAEFGGHPSDRPEEPFAPGSESWGQFLARAGGCLQEMVSRHEGQRVLVIAHGETVEAAHRFRLGIPSGVRMPFGFSVAHASLTWWSLRWSSAGDTRWSLVLHGAVSGFHLIRPSRELRS